MNGTLSDLRLNSKQIAVLAKCSAPKVIDAIARGELTNLLPKTGTRTHRVQVDMAQATEWAKEQRAAKDARAAKEAARKQRAAARSAAATSQGGDIHVALQALTDEARKQTELLRTLVGAWAGKP